MSVFKNYDETKRKKMKQNYILLIRRKRLVVRVLCGSVVKHRSVEGELP